METRINEMLFRHMMTNAVIPLVGTSLGSILIGFTLYVRDHRPFDLLWVLLVHIVLVIRVGLIRHYQPRLVARYNEVDARRLALSVGLSGIAWGMSCLFLIDADMFAATLVITGVQAMVMGGVVTFGVVMSAFLAFALPAMLPVIAVLIWNGELATIVTAFFSLIFLGLMILIAGRFSRFLRRTWQLTFENEELVAALTEASGKLRKMAYHDGLTGLANRSHFNDRLQLEHARMTRSREPLSLIMLDVDHFKRFNDTYGHIAGDHCLQQVATVFKEIFCRASDLPARFGGEEFIALLTETDREGARLLAEKVRVGVMALAIPHSASETADHVTVSIGVATINRADLVTPEAAIVMVDAALYRAKSLGRNRISEESENPVAFLHPRMLRR
jgi:diguanylate cyclase (GGDEF)-like protein